MTKLNLSLGILLIGLRVRLAGNFAACGSKSSGSTGTAGPRRGGHGGTAGTGGGAARARRRQGDARRDARETARAWPARSSACSTPASAPARTARRCLRRGLRRHEARRGELRHVRHGVRRDRRPATPASAARRRRSVLPAIAGCTAMTLAVSGAARSTTPTRPRARSTWSAARRPLVTGEMGATLARARARTSTGTPRPRRRSAWCRRPAARPTDVYTDTRDRAWWRDPDVAGFVVTAGRHDSTSRSATGPQGPGRGRRRADGRRQRGPGRPPGGARAQRHDEHRLPDRRSTATSTPPPRRDARDLRHGRPERPGQRHHDDLPAPRALAGRAVPGLHRRHRRHGLLGRRPEREGRARSAPWARRSTAIADGATNTITAAAARRTRSTSPTRIQRRRTAIEKAPPPRPTRRAMLLARGQNAPMLDRGRRDEGLLGERATARSASTAK